MATSISFTDGEGLVTLANGFSAPGDRFRNWEPLNEPIGPLHEGLGTGIPYKWEHREDNGAKFELPYIPNTLQRDCIRLIRWLKRGGLVTVNTGDTLGASYDCYIWPGSAPKLSPADPKDLRHILSLSVLNSTAGEVMTCIYP